MEATSDLPPNPAAEGPVEPSNQYTMVNPHPRYVAARPMTVINLEYYNTFGHCHQPVYVFPWFMTREKAYQMACIINTGNSTKTYKMFLKSYHEDGSGWVEYWMDCSAICFWLDYETMHKETVNPATQKGFFHGSYDYASNVPEQPLAY